jgi:hypothetical protein
MAFWATLAKSKAATFRVASAHASLAAYLKFKDSRGPALYAGPRFSPRAAQVDHPFPSYASRTFRADCECSLMLSYVARTTIAQ